MHNIWYLLFFLDDCLLSSLDWNPTRTTDRCFPEVKRPGREVDHLPPSSAEVKNGCSYTSTLHICLHDAARDNSVSLLNGLANDKQFVWF